MQHANEKSQSSSRPMQFFLVGAQKSGTTTLANLLNQHPDLCLSNPKEPDYFGGNFDKGPTWYEERYDNKNCPARLEASQVYTMTSLDDLNFEGSGPDIPKRIAKEHPEARFIYILRNHADRAYSAYWHNVREDRENKDFRAANLDPDEYIAPSLYCRQLDHYFRFFDRDRFLVLRFDDFKENPLETTRLCAGFLGLAPFDGFHAIAAKNRSFKYTRLGQIVRNLTGSRENMKRLTTFTKKLVPNSAWSQVKKLAATDTPGLSETDREWINQFFADDAKRLKEEYGFEL